MVQHRSKEEKELSVYTVATAINLTALDWNTNEDRVRAVLRKVRKRKESIKLVLFPELSLSGPGCEDQFLAPSTSEESLTRLRALLPESKGVVAIFGLPVAYHNKQYKAMAVLADGELLGFSAARYLANQGVHYEGRFFTPWTGKSREILIDGRKVPLGQSRFDVNHFSFTIESLEEFLSRRESPNTDLVLLPGADVFELGAQARRRDALQKKSKELDTTLLHSTLLGNESGSLLYDGGALIIDRGELVAQSERFSYRDDELAAARWCRTEDGLCRTSARERLSRWERSDEILFEEFARAVPLGLFDYMRKCRAHGFTLSLSGGADSASIAVLIRLMIHFGLQKDSEIFLKKLSYIPAIDELVRKKKISGSTLGAALLTTVYQGTRNSSAITKNAARAIAKAVVSKHYEFDIDPFVEDYKALVSKSIGRTLSWSRDDLALQNIQARVRVPGVWLLANLSNSLLLSTGNRSEGACGYATMDGDTSGAICPISGIDKAFLRRWLLWLETQGPTDAFTVPAIHFINEQAPTAELRPGGTQTDEADLMPYSILELFEEEIIRDRKTGAQAVESISQQLKREGQSVPVDQLRKWCILFMERWSRSQWKRARSAPGFHLDDHDLSPSSWCRFPLLSGGFADQISELRNES